MSVVTPVLPRIVAGRIAHCERCGVRARSVCASMPEGDLERLAAIAVIRQCGSGETIMMEGEPAAAFHNITSGFVRLHKSLADGREQVTGFARAGDFLGLAADETYGVTATAIGPVQLCRFPRDRFRKLMHALPALEDRLLAVASHELVIAQERMLLLGRKTARERVASFLLDLAPPCGEAGMITLPMTRTDIADFLGLTIETVSRTLNAFRRERRIDMQMPTQISLLDRNGLTRIAQGDALEMG
jgi:CRP/FNR family transcriptional regulator